MRNCFFLIIIFFCFSFFFNSLFSKSLVHNSANDIKTCQGELKLKLIRIWGGDDEKDENKFFKTPIDIAFDENDNIYICDMHNHHIKVFNSEGQYLRTIGRRGKGPGDLLSPNNIEISSNNDVWVYENAGLRFQKFSPLGKSKKIINSLGFFQWFGLNSQENLITYSGERTYNSGKIVCHFNNEGKVIREIGVDLYKAHITTYYAKYQCAIDKNDIIYIANSELPLIRKYKPDGKLLLAISFDPYFKIPVEFRLKQGGDEVEMIDKGISKDKIKISGSNIQFKSERKFAGALGMAVDSKNRIYILARSRELTDKEKFATRITGNPKVIRRDKVDYKIINNLDVNRIIVFSSKGSIIAKLKLKGFCDNIVVHKDRLFIIDGFYDQQILEYEIDLKI